MSTTFPDDYPDEYKSVCVVSVKKPDPSKEVVGLVFKGDGEDLRLQVSLESARWLAATLHGVVCRYDDDRFDDELRDYFRETGMTSQKEKSSGMSNDDGSVPQEGHEQ